MSMIEFPKHLSLVLTHNEHLLSYDTVEYEVGFGHHGYDC